MAKKWALIEIRLRLLEIKKIIFTLMQKKGRKFEESDDIHQNSIENREKEYFTKEPPHLCSPSSVCNEIAYGYWWILAAVPPMILDCLWFESEPPPPGLPQLIPIPAKLRKLAADPGDTAQLITMRLIKPLIFAKF